MSCPTKKKAQRPIKHFPTDLIIIHFQVLMMTIIPTPFVYLPVWIFAVLSLLQEEVSLHFPISLPPSLSYSFRDCDT